MSLAIKAMFEPVRYATAAAITAAGGAWVSVGVNRPLLFPARQFWIQNLTETLLMFSFDGVNDHFPLAPDAFLLDDVCSNTSISNGFFIAKGSQLWVRSVTVNPSVSGVYFTVMYGIDY